MSKTSCTALAIVFVIIVSLGIVITVPNDTRGFIFNASCRLISKAGVDIDEDHCVKGIAVFFEDTSICEGIIGKQFIGENDDGDKTQLENPPKMQCLTDIAVKKNDPLICDQVNGVLIANTRVDCLYDVAVKNNNKEACDMIGDEEQSRMGFQMNKDNCLAQLQS